VEEGREGFTPALEWAQAERELQMARALALQEFRFRFPRKAPSETEAWMVTPKKVFFRDVEKGRDWYFVFESSKGPYAEMIVLASGGIEGLDLGLSR
jgi:hypothetical protein